MDGGRRVTVGGGVDVTALQEGGESHQLLAVVDEAVEQGGGGHGKVGSRVEQRGEGAEGVHELGAGHFGVGHDAARNWRSSATSRAAVPEPPLSRS